MGKLDTILIATAAGAEVAAGAAGADVAAGMAVGAAVAAPPQAASAILAAITSETKTNKRLDISYSSEYYLMKMPPAVRVRRRS